MLVQLALQEKEEELEGIKVNLASGLSPNHAEDAASPNRGSGSGSGSTDLNNEPDIREVEEATTALTAAVSHAESSCSL